MRDGTQIEVVTVGREGLAGAQAMLDGDVASRLTWTQVAGDAYRCDFKVFTALCAQYAPLADLVHRYISAQLDVMAQSIACNRLHYVRERCARWLLMTIDRVGRDEFPLTHEVLATMLGVRRAGVSIAASELQDLGFISYSRGRFTSSIAKASNPPPASATPPGTRRSSGAGCPGRSIARPRGYTCGHDQSTAVPARRRNRRC